MKGNQHRDALRVRNIYRRINGMPLTPLLSLDLLPSEIVFMVGPSGIGKSTALRMIACLDPFETFDSSDNEDLPLLLGADSPQSLTVPVWRRRVMYMSQTRVGVPGTPVDTFNAALRVAAREKDTYTSSVIDNFLPACVDLGMTEDLAMQEWQTLSGGQAQRAALAIRLALRPHVLLLDEITSACDPESTRLVELAVRKHCQDHDTAVLWVSHDPQQPGRVAAPHDPKIINFTKLDPVRGDDVP